MSEADTSQLPALDAEVIVIGAGPVGLMLACELSLMDVDVLVLERADDFDRRLRAPGITARSIQALDRRGLLDPLMAATADVEPAYKTERGPLGEAPDMLPIRAGVLEEVLHGRLSQLGGRLERGVSVTSVVEQFNASGTAGTEPEQTDQTDHVAVTSTDAEGTEKTLRAQYVVGCDGGRSTVRKAVGIDFPGGGPEVTGYQAVVTVEPEGILERAWRRTPRGITAYALGPSRIVSVEFDTPSIDRSSEVTLDEVQDSLRRTSGVEVTLRDPVSLSRFTGNCRLADRYRNGRVLLAGDAAHVHPPFGGQGLNLGLQDAVNLGWKLAATVHGTAATGLLDSYEDERRPVAARVLRNSEAATRLLHPGVDNTAPYELFFQELMTDPAVKRRLHEVYAMKDLFYAMSATEASSERVGRAAPDLVLTSHVNTCREAARMAARQRSGLAVLVYPTSQTWPLETVGHWRDRVEAVPVDPLSDEETALMLVRPDGYVAWAPLPGSTPDPGSLAAALKRWFGEPLSETEHAVVAPTTAEAPGSVSSS
ncbi:FAD-dependent monooxygenase [Streptomyces sp. NBC_01591]|uniref:FAD-dependent monooxygenase n=1 Tax=Streptomyces sp. NBC_01591 TaxID=2975888 RepID=UPI002DD92B76|nr:FAD-dependent monooxygenase [Streptomyces sp. NBC_01591]WSD68344.1 FAD-dependent monooxygenase [Streptomyces sp. NBC_01591]